MTMIYTSFASYESLTQYGTMSSLTCTWLTYVGIKGSRGLPGFPLFSMGTPNKYETMVTEENP